MTEEQINKRLADMQAEFDRLIPSYKRRVIMAFTIARSKVNDIIAKYAKDGVIPKTRKSAAVKELDAVEAALYRDLLSQTTSVVEDAAKAAGSNVNEVLVAAIGVGALLALQGQEDPSGGFTEGMLIAIGLGLLALMRKVVSTVIGRKGDDGKNLRDRLRTLSADAMNEARKTLRKSIQNSEDTATVQRRMSELFGTMEWRLNRITETEPHVAYRTAIAQAAESSDLVAALRIIDFPHGGPGEHERHKCYQYAHADEHGMGEGVYPLNTRKIRNPHPQCRSRLLLVLKEGVLDA